MQQHRGSFYFEGFVCEERGWTPGPAGDDTSGGEAASMWRRLWCGWRSNEMMPINKLNGVAAVWHRGRKGNVNVAVLRGGDST